MCMDIGGLLSAAFVVLCYVMWPCSVLSIFLNVVIHFNIDWFILLHIYVIYKSSFADHRRSHQFLLTVMMTSWTMLATKGNQETEHLNPNWWHELSTTLLGKLQGKMSLPQSVILLWFIIWCFGAQSLPVVWLQFPFFQPEKRTWSSLYYSGQNAEYY
jgi:hypothetical protein